MFPTVPTKKKSARLLVNMSVILYIHNIHKRGSVNFKKKMYIALELTVTLTVAALKKYTMHKNLMIHEWHKGTEHNCTLGLPT